MQDLVDSRRVRTLNRVEGETSGSGPVVYVMAREQRIQDNWALLYACQRAQELDVGIVVLFVVGPMFNNGSARHNEWLVASLQEVAEDCEKASLTFHVELGGWAETVQKFTKEHDIAELVFDFNPLEPIRSWRDEAAKRVAIPVHEVDARNIIPCWQASPKAEFAAHTFRPKVHKVLKEFLTEYPKLPKLAPADITLPTIDWNEVRNYRHCDYSEPIPDTYTPGTAAGLQQLDTFINSRLETYAKDRNDPTKSGVSDLSPYLRWGNISAQRVALTVQAASVAKDDKDAFLEELVVRRELTDNYVYYTAGYNTVAGAHEWAQKTLKEHWHDTRDHIYSYEEFAAAKTHDDLWNAMQTQMVTEGKMHGWCRMYWAKKILEWTKSPDEAIEIALTLNDQYELDGRDSNGIVGVMWSICGVHDRAWTERPVYGKIRYMNYNGAKRKFPVAEYIERYGPQTETLV